MAASPFAFYRGAAAVLAADLAESPRTGLKVQLCGDAHLVNFGGFASPERSPGVRHQRLRRDPSRARSSGTSSAWPPASRSPAAAAGSTPTRCAEIVAELGARPTARRCARSPPWTTSTSGTPTSTSTTSCAGGAASSAANAVKNFQKTVDKAESKDRLKAEAKLTQVVDGELAVPQRPAAARAGRGALRPTPTTTRCSRSDPRRPARLPPHACPPTVATCSRATGSSQLARKVVGVGSVGTRCWVALMVGRDNDDPLFLQVKEAEASVLEPYLGKSGFANHGQRVVEGQRLMQAASDIFLGLGAGRRRRRPAPRLLHAPALGLEGVGQHRHHGRPTC